MPLKENSSKMTLEQTKTKFYFCCRLIVQNKEAKALNYCVNYAKTGLHLTSILSIKTQVLYILNNMTHWRGDTAKKVRKRLKEVQQALKNC